MIKTQSRLGRFVETVMVVAFLSVQPSFATDLPPINLQPFVDQLVELIAESELLRQQNAQQADQIVELKADLADAKRIDISGIISALEAISEQIAVISPGGAGAVNLTPILDALEAALAGKPPPVVDLQPVLDALEASKTDMIAAFETRPFVFPKAHLAAEFARHQVKLRDLITAPWEKIEHNTETGEEKILGKFQWRLLSKWPAPDIPDPDPDPVPDPTSITIEAEAFDRSFDTDDGGPGIPPAADITESVSGSGGKVLGYCKPGEWLEYDVNINHAGRWNITLTTGNPRDGGQMSVQVRGQIQLYDIPNTGGWDIFNDTSKVFDLPQSDLVIRVTMTKGSDWGWTGDLDKITLTKLP